MAKHTLNELGNMSREELITIILSMQGQLDALNENIEKLIEQVPSREQLPVWTTYGNPEIHRWAAIFFRRGRDPV